MDSRSWMHKASQGPPVICRPVDKKYKGHRGRWPLKTSRSGLQLRFFRRWIGFVLHFALKDNLGLGTKAFVVHIFDDFPHVDIAADEMQGVIGHGVGGEPVLAVDLFAVGHKLGSK